MALLAQATLLASSVLLPPASPSQEPDEATVDTEYLTYHKAPRTLTIVDGFVAVHHEPNTGELATVDVLEAGAGDLALVRSRYDWSLFAHPSASSEESLFAHAAASGESDSSVLAWLPKGRDLVERLVNALTESYVVSPIFRDPDGLLLTFGSRLAAGFERGVPLIEVETRATAMGAEIIQHRLGGDEDAYLFELHSIRSGFDNLAIANELAQRPEVRWAEPEITFLNPRPASECIPLSPAPTTAELNQNWWDDGTWGINVAGAWAECGGESAPGQPLLRVGVIGDGVDLTHPDLYKLGSSIPGNGFITGQPATGGPVDDCDKHETLVAGMIAMVAGGGGAPSLSGVGAAPKIEIVSARANPQEIRFQPPRCAPADLNATAVANAIQWVSDPPSLGGAGARVINYSWNLGQSESIENAVATAIANDVMIFAPVGNSNTAVNAFLSGLQGVLAVGGIDQNGQRWREQNPDAPLGVLYGSSYGPGLRYVAPAAMIYTTDRQGSSGMTSSDWSNVWVGRLHTIPLSGTSFATPLVAGVAALIRALRPDLTGPQVDQILCETAVPVPNWELPEHAGDEDPPDCGLIDATAALLAAKSALLLDGFESGNTNFWTDEYP